MPYSSMSRFPTKLIWLPCTKTTWPFLAGELVIVVLAATPTWHLYKGRAKIISKNSDEELRMYRLPPGKLIEVNSIRFETANESDFLIAGS